MGIWPEPHGAVQSLWNAQLQPLNPVPLPLYSAAFRALVISAQPSSWQTSPINELMLNREAWSGLCISINFPTTKPGCGRWVFCRASQEAYPVSEAPPEAWGVGHFGGCS